jgi:phage terminase large subunit
MPRRNYTKGHNKPQGDVTLSIPHLWIPRSYQRDLVYAMPANAAGTPERTRRRLMLRWHRRAGKDLTALALTIREMSQRPGLYWHILPTFRQAKSVLWDGSDDHAVPFLSRFPERLIKTKNETELMIELDPFPGQPSGSFWQARGADDKDSLRGSNPVGIVLSEFSEMDEGLWPEVLQPIIEANHGWALFIFTPKGRNHVYKLFTMAEANKEKWFTQSLTIDDTRHDAPGEDGLPCVTQEQVEEMRREGVQDAIIQQEYYVKWDGFLRGTIFGDLVTAARKDGRITRAPFDSNRPVGTCWDIGRTDSTAIWFYQRARQEICFIDYYEDNLKGADYYAKLLREKPYLVSRIILPHDARVKGFTASYSTEEYFQRVFRGVTVAEKTSIQSGIDMTRRLFSKFVFDEAKCARGIECLENYRRKWDDDKHDFSGEPIHSEYSHGADALRTGVVGGIDQPLDFNTEENQRNPILAMTDFSIFEPMEHVN